MSHSHYDAEAHLPPHHSPLPELVEEERTREPSAEDFTRVQSSEEFVHLRKTFRSFAFPMTAVFLVWYFAYVLLSTYAESFMSTKVLGNLNLGLLLGLAQFASTFLITWLYVRHANKSLDPVAAKLRGELEGEI
ncbi:DUF485 domain-containing protein [Georgenia sp. M64]|uniref:DUF485 domain-containing protein n=1 Tax=Georgenia sp. M64 TaxID=3120520 RepID=UPI0030E471F6